MRRFDTLDDAWRNLASLLEVSVYFTSIADGLVNPYYGKGLEPPDEIRAMSHTFRKYANAVDAAYHLLSFMGRPLGSMLLTNRRREILTGDKYAFMHAIYTAPETLGVVGEVKLKEGRYEK